MSVSVPGSRKIVVGQPYLSRLGETLAELPPTGNQVGLFKAQPGRQKVPWLRPPCCAHLGDRGCMIYEHRPSACRSFDCRAFSAMGLVEHCDPNHRTSDWEFATHRASPALATD